MIRNIRIEVIMDIKITPIPAKQMILIGATSRNSGKTTLALQIIDHYKNKVPIIAFECIAIQDHGDICPRGGKGCGICHGLNGNFDITEEEQYGEKDTMLLKKAGAEHVYLIRSLKKHMKDALEAALRLVPKDTLVICESNSARLVVEPACFVLIKSNTATHVKPTAKVVIEYADFILEPRDDSFKDFVQNKLPLCNFNSDIKKKLSVVI